MNIAHNAHLVSFLVQILEGRGASINLLKSLNKLY